jgi:hypothetical protein
MGILVNVANGIPVSNENPVALNPGDHFTWVNYTPNVVNLTNCAGFCTADSYGPIDANGGTAVAQVNSNPNGWVFSENPNTTWAPGGTHPGLPRIQNPKKAAEQREVA